MKLLVEVLEAAWLSMGGIPVSPLLLEVAYLSRDLRKSGLRERNKGR